uniref:Uncharacterized protein n=1 Tax=viral metagenome TaxID=1070528 RepID=A0A6M3L7C9_9ZZZZ
MEEKVKLSPAVQLVDLVWRNSFKGKRVTSWTRFNGVLQDALGLAIEAGMIFDKADFQFINDSYQFGYWGGNDGHMLGERYYAMATRYKNVSASQSFEAWKQRPPYIFDDVFFDRFFGHEKFLHARLVIRSGFKWNNEAVWVTSFAEDGTYLVACSYKDREKNEKGYPIGTEKIEHLYKITVGDLRKERQRRKTLAHIYKCADAMGTHFYSWLADLLKITFPDMHERRAAFENMMVPTKEK